MRLVDGYFIEALVGGSELEVSVSIHADERMVYVQALVPQIQDVSGVSPTCVRLDGESVLETVAQLGLVNRAIEDLEREIMARFGRMIV